HSGPMLTNRDYTSLTTRLRGEILAKFLEHAPVLRRQFPREAWRQCVVESVNRRADRTIVHWIGPRHLRALKVIESCRTAVQEVIQKQPRQAGPSTTDTMFLALPP